MPRNNDLEHRALQLILEADDEGLLQSELWKRLGVTSREGSRLALKFEEKGVVERKRVLHDGRWTYKLFSQTKPVTIDSIRDCPCINCDELDKCFEGGQMSPIRCPLLTAWVGPKAKFPEPKPET
ncbi:MAG: MarR family transcriptional regulator [Candidatus Bathyarchaeia archaeon]